MTVVVRAFTTSDASTDDLEQARRLMDLAFDDFADDDWRHALGGHHVVADAAGVIVAHAAMVRRTIDVAGEPWPAGYVEAVATHPAWQGQGHGSRVMAELATSLRRHHDLGALSTGEHLFYERLGWERWRGATFVRDGDHRRRTAEEDDGVMVLRFGASASVDLSTDITCEARPGDDW